MKRKILTLISACMMLSGCGFVQDENGSGIESHESAATADISQNKTDETMENVPTYTKEEDEASARYLQETYGAVNNRPKVILDCDMTYMGDDSIFNCFYDSVAFHICFRSNFQKQTVVPHDAAKYAVLNKAVFDMINDKNNTLASYMWIENQYSLYRRTVTYKSNCLDAIAAVSFLIPSCVSDSENYYVAVNYDEESPEYGRVTVSDVLGENTSFHEITFITAINTEMYWNFATDLLGHMKEKAEKGYLDYL